MKKIIILLTSLVVSSSVLAECPQCNPQCITLVPYNWNGFYIGLNGGGAWNNSRANGGSFVSNATPLNPNVGVDFAGRMAQGEYGSYDFDKGGFFTGGGQIGINWHLMPRLVGGVETDFEYLGFDQTTTRFFTVTPTFNQASIETASQKINWLGTVRGRLGVTFLQNRLMVSGNGGFAYGDVRNSFQTIGVPTQLSPNTQVTTSSSSTQTGWAAGGGLQYALSCKLSVLVEYLYFDLGKKTLRLDYADVGVPGNSINYDFRAKGNIIRAGINYKFNML